MTINENATDVLFCAHVIGDSLAEGYKEVSFTIDLASSVPLPTPENISIETVIMVVFMVILVIGIGQKITRRRII